MKFLALAVVCLVCSTWANEDVLRDWMSNIVHGDQFERRAVISALNSAAVFGAAKSFAGAIGKSSQGAVKQSQSFEDACLGSRPINTINPIRPINPFPWNQPFGGISSSIGGISALTKGKRESKVYNNRDIVFVLDTSGSVPQDQFDKAKQAINVLVESFCPSKFGNAVTTEGNKQVSVVLFGTTVTTEIDFSDSSRGFGYLQDKILDMRHRKEGGTATGTALTYVKNSVLGKGSSRLNNNDVSTDVIIITDGQCNKNCRVLGSEAEAIRKMGHGVNVFAMGVANARACELEIITGKGNSLAYGLGDFRNFDRFATAVKEIAQENAKKCA